MLLPVSYRYGSETKICHFIGPVKPWHHSVDNWTGEDPSLAMYI